MNQVRLHRDVVVECCRVLGKDVVAKHIWRCFQLACDLLRALDATEEYADCIANVAVQEHYQIPVWMHAVSCERKKPQIICALDLHLPPFSLGRSPGILSCTSTDLLTLTTFTYHVNLLQGGDLSK